MKSTEPLRRESSENEDLEDSSVGWGAGDDDGAWDEPEVVKRRCTDWPWCFVFVAFLALLRACRAHLHVLGAVHFHHLVDYRGAICGADEAVGFKYLYFCLQGNPTHDRMLSHDVAVCRTFCPDSTNTSGDCPASDFASHLNGSLPGDVETLKVQDYPTVTYLGMLCVPTDPELVKYIEPWVKQDTVLEIFAMMLRSWRCLVIVASLAVLMAMGYIAMLNRYGGYLVWGGLFSMTAFPLACSAYFLVYCFYQQQCPERSVETNLACGLGSLLLGALILRIACGMQEEISLSIQCIQWSCSCILHTPLLVLIPLTVLLLRITAVILTGPAFRMMMSQFYDDISVPDKARITPTKVAYAFFLGWMFYWQQQVISAFADFVTVYSTEVWYFRGGMTDAGAAPGCLFGRACWVALRYHAGTLVLGSLVVGMAQPMKALFGWATTVFNRAASTHPYCEVARTSTPFLPAISEAQAFMLAQDKDDSAHILDGTARVFKVAGLAAIIFICYCCSFFLFHCDSDYTVESSPEFVPNPLLASGLGAVVAALVAAPFMNLFDTISDTILYCHTVEASRTQLEEEKESLESSWIEGVADYARNRMGCCAFRTKSISDSVSPSASGSPFLSPSGVDFEPVSQGQGFAQGQASSRDVQVVSPSPGRAPGAGSHGALRKA